MTTTATRHTRSTNAQDPTRTRQVDPPQVQRIRRWLQDEGSDPHASFDRRIKRVRQLIRAEGLELDVMLHVAPSFIPEALRFVANLALDDTKTARLLLSRILESPTHGEMPGIGRR